MPLWLVRVICETNLKLTKPLQKVGSLCQGYIFSLEQWPDTWRSWIESGAQLETLAQQIFIGKLSKFVFHILEGFSVALSSPIISLRNELVRFKVFTKSFGCGLTGAIFQKFCHQIVYFGSEGWRDIHLASRMNHRQITTQSPNEKVKWNSHPKLSLASLQMMKFLSSCLAVMW